MKTRPTQWIARAIVLASLSFSTSALAASQLQSVQWEGNAEQSTIGVRFNGVPSYRTAVFDGGTRVRITVRDAQLNREAADIAGRGNVRGVFPYLGEKPGMVHIDVLLKQPVPMNIVPTAYGIRLIPGSAYASAPAQVQSRNAQTDTNASQQRGQIVSSAATAMLAGGMQRVAENAPHNAIGRQIAGQQIVGGHQSAVNTWETVNNQAQAQIGDVVHTGEAMVANAQPGQWTPWVSQAQMGGAVDTGHITHSADVSDGIIVGDVTHSVMSQTQPVASGNLAIQNIQYSPLPGGRVQIDLTMNGRPGEPSSFTTNEPARLALDFFGVTSTLDGNPIEVRSGSVESVTTIETRDRTRLVVDLVRPVAYKTEIRDNGITIILESATGEAVNASTTTSRQFAGDATRPNAHAIQKIDFRRDKDGGGKIIIDLSGPKVGVDVKEQSGEILIDFINTAIPGELERRLDVVDFATPVQTIDAFSQGQHSRIVVTPIGKYRQLAYQSGNIFTLSVSPLSPEEEAEASKDEFGYSGEKLSLNFQKISVRAALQVIADFTGLNFVTSDSVKGSLTLRLQDVPWDQALDIILQTKGLSMRQKGNVVWVADAQEMAALERQQLEASKQVAELEPLVSELIQINYAKATDIADLLKSIEPVGGGVKAGAFGSVSVDKIETTSNTLLSPRGQVTVDDRTNSILVQDTSGKIREIRKLIARLDKPVRQVVIETRIVEAQDDFARVLGARLAFHNEAENARLPGTNSSNLGNVSIGSSAASFVQLAEDDKLIIAGDGTAVDLPARGIGADSATSIAARITRLGSGLYNTIALELSALQASGKGKIIASPRIMTANQQEATIKQGQERVFPPSGFNTEATRDEAVLLLTVKPQITPDDRIVLDVLLRQDVFVDTAVNIKDKKEVITQVLLENGETVVIGGIYQEQTTEDVVKTPFLGDIPVLGNLFKRRSSDNNRKELLVFLTPRILDSALSLR